MSGLYIHIPFCASRCIYCGFYSTTLPQLQSRYVAALCREMALRRDYLPREEQTLHTIYIGGGTPSQLSPALLRQIVEGIKLNFTIADAVEFTMECNPDDVTPDYAQAIARLGVNRVSMGAQTFSDARLRFLHRRHSAAEVTTAMANLRKAGISNISLDLMFGFPDETLDDWNSDLRHCLALKPQHISAYSLMYEEGTPLMRLLEQGKIKEIDEELSRRMFYLADEVLGEAGYEHYEISNYALPGFRSRHNSSYWHDLPYLGLGAAAHSYNRSSRQWNVADIKRYILQIEQGIVPMEKEEIDAQTHYNDLITTALRTSEGIDLSRLDPRFRDYILTSGREYLDDGSMKLTDNHLRITRQAFYVSDEIMADLMFVD